MAEDLRHVPPDRRRHGLASPPLRSGRHAARLDPGSRLRSRRPPGNPTPTSDRSRSCRRGCGPSTSTTPTSSSSCCPALGTGTACPRASGSGRPGSRQTDPDKTFKVGLIYGPSGCGKSSLVKAGLLPRLAEARPAGLRRGDRRRRPRPGCSRACARRVPTCPRSWAWSSRWRRCGGAGSCVRAEGAAGPRPVRAVAASPSGARRTRSWSPPCGSATASTSRRSSWCGTISGWRRPGSCGTWRSDLVEGENIAAVDLFDPRHARKVLTAFGRAYGGLPEKTGDLTTDQKAFLDQAVAGLAQDGKVISVRLALFAEMVKGKPWTPATLAGGRRHRGRRRDVPRRDLQRPDGASRSIASTRRRPRRS